MPKHKFVYIAGPYTDPDLVVNTHSAIIAGNIAAERGYCVFIPHQTLLWHMIKPHDYEFWMQQDLGWITKCDYLIRLPGDSVGADREVELAKGLGIQVFNSPFQLPVINIPV